MLHAGQLSAPVKCTSRLEGKFMLLAGQLSTPVKTNKVETKKRTYAPFSLSKKYKKPVLYYCVQVENTFKASMLVWSYNRLGNIHPLCE